MKSKAINLADYIKPINMNGMEGRMLRLPSAKSKREILLLYGLHASIERMQGIAEELTKYGTVTLPDFPGFGGMDSFYTIGEKPSLDNMADYLASFIKMRYKRKRVSIVAMSFGFVVATRMLQRNPELVKKVDLVVSVVGFAHKDDFIFSKTNYFFMRWAASFFSMALPSAFLRHFILRGPLIRATYRFVADKHVKLADANEEEREKRINFEITLWKNNDIRTYMDNTVTMLKLDLCKQRIDLPVWHVGVYPDRYFDNSIVEQHLGVIYSEVHHVKSAMAGHAPTVVATAKDAAPFIPPKIRRLLSKNEVV